MGVRVTYRARPLAAALITTLAAAAASTVATAQAADGFTVKTLHFAVTTGPNDDKACDIVGDLYKPDTASKANPAPAILTTNGFGGSKDDQASAAKAYAKHGYVVLSYSGLGFGGSTCKITLDDRDWDGKAGSQLVTFLGGGGKATDGTSVDYVKQDATAHDGKHHANDPRVGMIGGSYGGQIQFAIAGIDPRVDTIVPIITWNDLSYSLAPNNTSFFTGVSTQTPGTAKLFWATGFFALGVAQGVEASPDDPARLLPCPNFEDSACLSLAQTGALGGPNDATTAFLRHASVASFIEDIRIPTLLSQGETDTLFNLQEAVATYKALKKQGTPVKMIWRSGGHSGGSIPGEDVDKLDKPNYEGRTYFEWFEHYLKDAPAAPSLDFTFFRDWVKHPDGDATVSYGRAPSYPVGTTKDEHLSSDGTLVADPAKVRPGSVDFLTSTAGLGTSYTEISLSDPGAAPVDAPGTVASFLSAPLTTDTEVVGIPSVDLRFSAPVQDTTSVAGNPAELVVYVRLEDQAPDGTTTLPRKLVSPVRIARPGLPVHVELPGIAHRFEKGHRYRLVVYGGDLAYRGSNVAAPVSLLTDTKRPGVLHLPIAAAGAYGAVVGAAVPKKARCKGTRTITLTKADRKRLKSGRVVIKGRTVAKLEKGRATARVPRSARTVKLVLKLKNGRTVTRTLRFRAAC